MIIILAFMAAYTCQASENSPPLEIAKSVFLIEGGNGKGSNVGVILDEGSITLVDTMIAESRDYLLNNLKTLSNNPVEYVLMTHDHFDHTGSNEEFLNSNSVLIASDKAELEKNANFISFSDAIRVNIHSRLIEGYAVNSHDKSDVIYRLAEENVIFLGDIYTIGWYPSFFSGGLAGQVDSLNLAISLGNAETKYVPGHGEVSSIDDLKTYRQLCEAWVERIMELSDKGMMPEKIKNDSRLLEIRERFSNESTNREGFDRWLEQLIINTIEIQRKST
ncbi:MBL fold metallo-hydrolase [Gilvimarinus sp. SDUM040013]|uniref:MBL fold metallo-hydrolase n=2 Tax=Gilvimarinus gilvus TaxID=3058038 RepID=A0ABU4S6D2_9GAMM|nr:MBL fold metallo-hydrolase [Gilvimarinus sp. SDUM040013]